MSVYEKISALIADTETYCPFCDRIVMGNRSRVMETHYRHRTDVEWSVEGNMVKCAGSDRHGRNPAMVFDHGL